MRFRKMLPGAGACWLLTLLAYGVSAQVPPLPADKKDSSVVIRPDTTKQLTVTVPTVRDTVQVGKLKHSPRKATLLSLAFPGLGQVYNRRYWKLPILYAGFGTIGYFIVHWNGLYQEFASGYLNIIADPSHKAIFIKGYGSLDKDRLKQGRELFRRYRDLNIILVAGLWALNIVEANIDAHLKGFDLSDDLSLHIKPGCSQDIIPQPVPGLTLALTWK